MNLKALNIDTEVVEQSNLEEEFWQAPQTFAPPDVDSYIEANRENIEQEQEDTIEEAASSGHLKKTSKRLVNAFDNIVAWALAHFVAKNNKAERYRLSQSDRNQLAEAVAEIMPEKIDGVSPTMQIVFLLFSMYSNSYDKAANDAILAEKDREIEELKRENELMKIYNERQKYENTQATNHIQNSGSGD